MRRLMVCALALGLAGAAGAVEESIQQFRPAMDDGIRACVAFMQTGRTGQHTRGYWDDLGLGSLSHDFRFAAKDGSGEVQLTYGFAFVGRAMRPNNCFVRFNQEALWQDWLTSRDSFAREEMGDKAQSVFGYATRLAREVYGEATQVRDSASGRGGFSVWCHDLENGTPVSIEAEWFANKPRTGPLAEVSFSKRLNEACDKV
ncbi:MAG: hypothetical protein AAF613_07075 [Pseudomonadota bacterium]